MTKYMSIIALGVALGAVSLFAEGKAFWQEGGVSIRDSTFNHALEIVLDGRGGAIAVWTDDRWQPMDYTIYVQRIDSSGTKLWPDSGVAACQPPEYGYWLAAAPDGAGGVVIYWQEYDIRLRAQRLDGNGTRLWGDSSVVVFDTARFGCMVLCPGMCPDGRGGCVMHWVMNYYDDDSIVLRAQYMDSLGQQAWGAQGRRIARDVALYGSVGVTSLASQGFVFTWIRDNGEIYAQRLDTAGNEVWTASVCSGVPVYGYPVIVRMDEGVLVCWTDMRNGDRDVYAQKLNPSGSPLWAQNGVPVCRAAGQQGGNMGLSYESVRAEGLPDGGALVAFYDQGRGRTAISCQRLSADGDMTWDSTGAEAGRIMDKDSLFGRLWFGLVPDTTGGAIVTWPKHLPSDSSQVWAQHLNAAGSACWDTGLCISEFALCNDLPLFRTTTDAKNGVIGCWEDWRFGGPRVSIYAQRYGDGPTSLAESRVNPPPAVQLTCASPLRAGAAISLPQCGEQSVTLDLFDACGRRVCCLWQGRTALPVVVRWSGKDDTGRRLPAGVYVLRLVAGEKLVASRLLTAVR